MAALTENLNFLQPTSFKLVIDRENYPNLEYFAQTVNHPSMDISPAEVAFRKGRSIPIAGGSVGFGELSATIILDEDMTAYTEMFNWMIRMIDNPVKGALDRDGTDIPTNADITLSVLSSHNNQVKQIRYKECIPTTLGDIAFAATDGGTEFLTFAVSFRFTQFEIV